MHGEFGLDLEAIGGDRQRFDKAARERAVARKDVGELAAEEPVGDAVEQCVAPGMTYAHRRGALRETRADDHVKFLLDHEIDQFADARGVISRITVGQHIHVSLDIGKHATDHVAFTLPGLAPHDGPGGGGALRRPIGRIVVVDIDHGVGTRTGKRGDRFRDRGLFLIAWKQDCEPHSAPRPCSSSAAEV